MTGASQRDNSLAKELALATSRSSTRSDQPSDAAQELLRGALRVTGASRGRLYLLNLATGSYESYAQISRGPKKTALRYADYARIPPAQLLPLEKATVTLQPQLIASVDSYEGPPIPSTYSSRLVVPIVRRSTCLGLLDLDADEPGHFTEPLVPVLDRLGPLLDIAELMYERRHLVDLLRESQRPIDFSLNEGDFYGEVMLLAALSAQIEFAVLREFTDEHELRCLGTFGFDESKRELFDLSPIDHYPPFAEVVQTRLPHIACSMKGDMYDTLRARDEISKVSSFVAVPVLVGKDIFGTFSFGSSLEYHYSDAETTALTSLANGLGVTIYNYRNFQRAALEVASYVDIGTAITAVEVAQATRHEARGLIDDAIVDLLTVTRVVQSSIGGRAAGPILEKANAIEERLHGLNIVLDKIKTASRAPSQEKRVIGLQEVWEQAKSQLTGKLGQARVESCSYDGRDVDVYVAVDWFRQVFINLMLNSLDAFASGSTKKRGRRIRLVVERPSDRAREIVMSYVDNAGGINPASLKRMDGEPVTAPIDQAIFQPNVTSKSDGSGWGLALVRKILGDHGGSVSLIDYRGGGTTFRITVPRAPELVRKEAESV